MQHELRVHNDLRLDDYRSDVERHSNQLGGRRHALQRSDGNELPTLVCLQEHQQQAHAVLLDISDRSRRERCTNGDAAFPDPVADDDSRSEHPNANGGAANNTSADERPSCASLESTQC
jgi:hypothetical protein